jgi:hypothetical protein
VAGVTGLLFHQGAMSLVESECTPNSELDPDMSLLFGEDGKVDHYYVLRIHNL